MDKVRAKHFEKALVGQSVEGWQVLEYINSGKSAGVFKAQNGNRLGAVKFFDPEIIEKHGAEIQVQRIEREKALIGKSHPNLVEILGGGHWTGPSLPLGDMYFIVMEYLPWKNLAEALGEVPVGAERLLIRQVASAARFLEELQICHRDIKPENIAISHDFKTAKLLDLGVIRPHGTKPITDGTNGKIFIGTLKYSPPEFLLREEQDTQEGWRAIKSKELTGLERHAGVMQASVLDIYTFFSFAGFSMLNRSSQLVAFFPPGGTPRLCGMRDARPLQSSERARGNFRGIGSKRMCCGWSVDRRSRGPGGKRGKVARIILVDGTDGADGALYPFSFS
jgi:serine/threonine protein kinase